MSLALLALLAAPRLALVVSIDAYPFSEKGLAPDRRLSAAANDAATVERMLALTGFATRRLLQGEATRAAVVRELDSLATRATSGSDVVFYFSGCGGNSGDARREPTLVAADGLKGKRTGDVPISLVERMAKRAHDKGAHVTVIVDACFTPPPFQSRSLEARAYKPIAKCVVRPGSIRPDLFRGPGVFLCPAREGGQTYEWRESGAASGWTSAFTDRIANATSAAVLKGTVPTVRALVRDADAYFKAKGEEYMPGLRIALPQDATDPGYDAPILTAGPLPAVTNPNVATRARRRMERDQAQARALRIAIDVDPDLPKERKAALRGRIVDLGEALAKFDENLKAVDPYERDPDRVLILSGGEGMNVTVQGGDYTKSQRHRFSGGDPEAAVADGLGAFMETDLCAKRLWNLAEGGGRMAWSPKMVRETIEPGQRIQLSFDAPQAGHLVLLNRDDADGEVKLIAPYWFEPDLAFAAGPQTAPRTLGNGKGSSSGGSVVVAFFVPAEAGALPALPAFQPKGDAKAQETAFAEPLVAYLKALLERLEKPDAAYGVARLQYKIP